MADIKTRSFQDLVVWQKAMDLVIEIYKVTEKYPQREIYSLVDQIRRAAISIPSNIAEGHQRHTTKEFIQFGHIAFGSCGELRTQVIISHRLHFISQSESDNLISRISEIEKMLYSLMKRIEK